MGRATQGGVTRPFRTSEPPRRTTPSRLPLPVSRSPCLVCLPPFEAVNNGDLGGKSLTGPLEAFAVLPQCLSGARKSRYLSQLQFSEPCYLPLGVSNLVCSKESGGPTGRRSAGGGAFLAQLGLGEVEKLGARNVLGAPVTEAREKGDLGEVRVAFRPVADGGAGDADEGCSGSEVDQFILAALVLGAEPCGDLGIAHAPSLTSSKGSVSLISIRGSAFAGSTERS